MFNFFPKISKEIVTILIENDFIIFANFQYLKKEKKFILKQYKNVNLNEHEIINLYIFNFQKLQNIFNNFLNQYKLKNSFIYIMLTGKPIKDNIFLLDDKDLNNFILQKNKVYISIFEKFYKKNNNNFIYSVQIPYSLIFQYQLLAINMQINITKIISRNFCLLKMLNFFNFNFNENIDINKLDLDFDNYFTNQNINHCLLINDSNINLIDDKFFIYKSLGLLI